MGDPTAPTTIFAQRQLLRTVVNQLALLDSALVKPAGTLVLSPDACATLEATLGVGCTRSSDALVEAVLRWAGVSIGGVRLDLTPAQLEEINYRAAKNNRSPAEELTAAVTLIQDHVFGSGYIAPAAAR